MFSTSVSITKMAAMSLNSTHPRTPSTVVTKELASLWHVMLKQERRVYCLKARRFSRQQNRNVRSELVKGEEDSEEEDCTQPPPRAAARGGS
ncbi:meiosis initiator protein-like [Salvelinus fontinalis]|uniref:meiosis initiator protein-like n=1 Tax=Salvelinus fontinalis TaxID=8038 RepID=UPI002485FDD1|nr:meiosis initiator protein-like [Salvelinus fontinalis]